MVIDVYKNPTHSAEDRAKDLLSKMTVDEKIDQMIHFPDLKSFVKTF